MKRRVNFSAASKGDIVKLFEKLDEILDREGRKISVTVIGGVSLILQGLRERSTVDIDLASGPDASDFQTLCGDNNIPVDIVTISSTVDFAHSERKTVFAGRKLTVESILPEDLVRLKLERFRKQDPEDVYAIIGETNMAYERFKAIVEDMLCYYVGNARELLLSAMIVVEQVYPHHRGDFSTLLDKL